MIAKDNLKDLATWTASTFISIKTKSQNLRLD
ncbi:hypothetical protein SAMN06265367_108161 [Algoriphagus winogradskyi]|uniref:Uncharacterized protein n=1 Tax=Algoriphagus winogradskyi TaxID=237017 RepID=A0ABY1PFL0_9BACT|nr:hypothetical protein SAMN06265367_108161 [Algoriphagus winogradskyi]